VTRPMSGAQRAMLAKPTAREITRANAALSDALSQDHPLQHEAQFRGWSVRVYRAPYDATLLRVFADAVGPDGKPLPGREAECVDMEAVREWMRGLPVVASPKPGNGDASNIARNPEPEQLEVAHA
jgi:hypothetical protein